MTRFRRAYRDVDGQRVEGTWRHVFTHYMNMYILTDLVIYADGAIGCGTGGLTDLDGWPSSWLTCATGTKPTTD